MRSLILLSAVAALLLTTVAARADEADNAAPPAAQVALSAYVEAFYQWNFARPGNGITNLRGYDDRHDSITLSNVVLDAAGRYERVSGRLALQVGHTPSSYYLVEPTSPAAGSAGESDAHTWRFLQQANLGWDAPLGRGVLFEAGLFLSPIGPESIAAKDDWNFSRSNLFFGLPAYHTGARATVTVNDAVKVVGAVYNGWNSVVDNNGFKSASAQLLFARGPLSLGVLYFGGVERARGAAEGSAWRHLFDAWAQLDATCRLQLLAHADAGFEVNDLGTSHWLAGALYARFRALDVLYLAARGDFMSETAGADGPDVAATIFWPATDEDHVARVASATFTVDLRPSDHLSFRLELRHDDANVDMFFGHRLDEAAPVPRRRTQQTLTGAAIAWF